MMARMSLTALLLCGILATPALSYWEYNGTTDWLGGPDWDSAPYGTWAWWETATGSVYYGIDFLGVSASAAGGGEVHCTPDWGLSRAVYAFSGAGADSSYQWVSDGTSKTITVEAGVVISWGHLEYWGSALNRDGDCESHSASGTKGSGGGGASYIGYYFPKGSSVGEAFSEGGSYATNNPVFVDVEDEDTYYFDSSTHGYYEGYLDFTADVNNTFYGTPFGNTMVASSSVTGMIFAQGQLVITGPYGWGGFDAEAQYGISGASLIELSGNIDDRQ